LSRREDFQSLNAFTQTANRNTERGVIQSYGSPSAVISGPQNKLLGRPRGGYLINEFAR
jgi:hypothetical protein